MDFMERIAAATKRSPFVRLSQGLLSMFLVATLAGCGAGNQNTSASTQQAAPQTYLAPYISGGAIGINSPPTAYTIDDTAQTFSVATYLVNGGKYGNDSAACARLAQSRHDIQLHLSQRHDLQYARGWLGD